MASQTALLSQRMMDRYMEDVLTERLVWLRSDPSKIAFYDRSLEPQAREDAKEIVAGGKAMEVLDALLPPECPECGR